MKNRWQWLILLLAILLPFFIIHAFPKFYHASDVDDFWRWSQAWKSDWQSIYFNCERCNYPFVGTLLSAGVMSSINTGSFPDLVERFRYYLAVIDALNVFLIWLILQKFQLKNAPFWAGVIGLLPSSWLGSSIWGQIDGAGQFLILLFFLLLFWVNQEKRTAAQFYLFAALAGFLLSVMSLTKQLVYFSVFALGIIFIANILMYSRKPAFVLASGSIAFIAFVLPVAVIDLILNLKDPYFSHLQYILATGSSHGDIISSMGFNVWVFFSDHMLESSHLPVPVQIGSETLFSITPYSTGLFLFLLTNVFLVYIFARQVLVQCRQETNCQFIFMAFVYIALVNLSFNITLTGTHERYLYHFYPFAIIACLVYLRSSANRFALVIVLAGACIYGAFLYGYLTRLITIDSTPIFQVMSIFHLVLFLFLVFNTIRQFNTRS